MKEGLIPRPASLRSVASACGDAWGKGFFIKLSSASLKTLLQKLF